MGIRPRTTKEMRSGWSLILIIGVHAALGGVLDLADLVAEYENEILGRAVGLGRLPDEEPVYRNDGEVGHPEEVHSWDANLKLGQVSAVATDINDDPVLFHRGPVSWTADSFGPDHVYKHRDQPQNTEDTILTVDQFTGKEKSKMGSNLFYMPHGITVDHDNNLWVTDVALHQVMMIPSGSDKPSLILGEKFVPGSDQNHFCQPTSVAVSKSGNVYIADGYCNNRVVVYDNKGRYITEIKGDWKVVHSITLFDEEDTLCVADREGGRIICMGAGINHPQFMGAKIQEIAGLGRVFGVVGRGSALIAVTGQGQTPPRGVTIDLSDGGRIVDQWGKELKNPHRLDVSREGDTVYVAEIGPNRLRKFNVVAPEDNIFNHETY